MQNFSNHFHPNQTNQSKQATDEQVENSAGGFVFKISPLDRFKRFLILGTENGSFYADERELTIENAKNVIEVILTKRMTAIDEIVRVSKNALAPKNDAAIFALALAISYGDAETRRYAESVFNEVIRTGTHLFQFLEYSKPLRGWGRLKKNAIQNWYFEKYKTGALPYQLIKYKNRLNWSHRDALRLAHIKPRDAAEKNLLGYAVGKVTPEPTDTGIQFANSELEFVSLPDIIRIHEEALREKSVSKLCELIIEGNLTHEMIPNDMKSYPEVWEALLQKMPLTAMIRNLGKMSSIGLITQRSNAEKLIISRLKDSEYLQKSRIHPIGILTAIKQYAAGHGFKGSLTWFASPRVCDALDGAFYTTFKNVTPIGKPIRLALDVSGSMTFANSGGVLTAREITAAVALVTAATEDDYDICVFDDRFSHINISPNSQLGAVMKTISGLHFAQTDCALPMMDAIKKQSFDFEMFAIYTDNETWFGNIHPFQALQQYRNKSGNRDAKLVVVATTPTQFSIANPADRNMLDISGFSSDVPAIIGAFGRDEL